MSESPYVLMLPKWFPNLRDPADGNFIQAHMDCISKITKIKILFVKGLEKEFHGMNNGEVQHLGKDLYIVYFRNFSGVIGKVINPVLYFFYQLKAFSSIRLENGLPSICHLHVMGRSSMLSNYLWFRYKIPFMVSEHWSGYQNAGKSMDWPRKILYRLLYLKAGAITAVSSSLLRDVMKIAPKTQSEVISNVVGNSFFKPLIPYQHKSYLVHVSNLKKEIKQADKIILMLEELAETRDDLTLFIAGDGPDRTELEKLANSCKFMKNKIHFKGQLTPTELADLVSAAAATISFSSTESQSIVLLESVALGIPVIAPEIGGIPEYFTGRGLLFEKNSKTGFQEAVCEVLDGKYSFDPNDFRNYALHNFSDETIGNRFLKLYRRISPSLSV